MADRVDLGSVVYKIVFEQGDVQAAAQKTSNAFDDISKKAKQTQSTLDSTSGSTKKIGNAFNDLGNRVSKTSGIFGQFRNAVLTGLGVGAGFTIVTQAVQGLKNAITGTFDAAVSFESAFAGIRKTVDASEEEFAALSAQVRQLAKDIPLSVEGIARIGELAGQLGIAKEDIIDFTKTIAAIGVTTNLTEEEAATSFARIANIFQIPAGEIENLASSVIDLGNNFATTEAEIVNFATRIAGTAKVVGLSTSDIAAIGTAFTSVGVEAEAGGTAVQKSLLAINDAVIAGGVDLQKFADLAGVTASDFAETWRSDPIKAFDLFVKGLGSSGDQAAAVLDELVAGDVRLKRAFLSVAQAGDLLTRAVDTSTSAFAANTALTDEANKRYETTESRLQMIQNRWNDLKITIGNFLVQVALPIGEFFIGFAEALTGTANKFSVLANAVKALGAAFIAYLSVSFLGKIRVAFMGLSTTIASFRAVLLGTASGITTATKLIGGLRVAVLALASPIGLVVAAVGALTFAWLSAKSQADAFTQAVSGLKLALDELSARMPTLTQETREFEQAYEDLLGKLDASMESQGDKALYGDFIDQVMLFREESLDLARALGATSEEIEKMRADFEFLSITTTPTTEEINRFKDALNGLADAGKLGPAVEEFIKDVELIKDASGDWAQAVEDAVEDNKDQYKDEVDNVDKFTGAVLDKYIAHVADSGEQGQAAFLAYKNNYNSEQTRRLIGLASDEILSNKNAALIADYVDSGDIGSTAGMLYAMGIIDDVNVFQAEANASGLSNAVNNSFASKQGEIFQSGAGSGSSLVSGIIAGISKEAPALGSVLTTLANSLGALSDIAPVFSKLGINVFGGLEQKVSDFQNQYTSFLNATKKQGGSTGGGGGGGGGGISSQAKEDAKNLQTLESEIDKNIDLYQKMQDSLDSIGGVASKSLETQEEKWMNVLNALSSTKKEVEDIEVAYETAITDITKDLEELEQNHADISTAIEDVLGKTSELAEGATDNFGEVSGAVDGATEGMENLGDSAGESVQDIDSAMQDLVDSTGEFQDVSENNNSVLDSYEKIQEAVEATVEKIQGLKDEIAGIDEELADNEKSFKENIADQVVDAEQKVKELKEELANLTPEQGDKASDIQAQIAEQEALIKSAQQLQIDFEKELEEARRQAGLNEIELLADKYAKEQELLATQKAEKEQQLADELAYLQEIKAQENIIYESQKQTLIGIETVLTNAYRENMKARLSYTEDFVNQSIELYRKLAEEAKKAQAAGANLSTASLSSKYDEIKLGEGTVGEQTTQNVITNEFNITVQKLDDSIDIADLAEQLSNYIKDDISQ
jgi:TP901 family phage tail tape measure protein